MINNPIKALIFIRAIRAIRAIRGQNSSNISPKTLAVLLFASLPLDAANPQPPAPAVPPAKAAAPAAKAVEPTPSRYAGKDIKAYVEALASQLAMRGRAIDPFGQPQDPNAKPVIKPTVAKATRRPTAEPPVALSDIVGKIEITTIMPKDKRFYVGGRSIGQGDKVPITFRNKQIKTEVTEVSARRIVFRNLDTGETGIRQLDMLPPGIFRGTLSTPGGIAPSQANAPLEIDSPSANPAGNPNN